MSLIHCVSISGGKDSAATTIMALETQPRESLRFAMADTGNEHETTLEYIGVMERTLGIKVEILRASFEREIVGKRAYVLEHWPRKGVPAHILERAAAILVPTGNPFLDLCMWKGRFPSRRAQFCTQHLKTIPLVEHQLGYIERGEADAVWSWQGVRLDESQQRRTKLQGTGACVKSFDVAGAGIYNYRPILRWNVADVFQAHELYGLPPNPLYSQEMTRVGCMPCINASKDEILAISKRFPEHFDRIAEWERLVGLASKAGESSFFPDPDRDAHLDKRGIRKVIEWSKTKRGGQLMDWIRIHDEPKACESAYGLCE